MRIVRAIVRVTRCSPCSHGAFTSLDLDTRVCTVVKVPFLSASLAEDAGTLASHGACSGSGSPSEEAGGEREFNSCQWQQHAV